MQSIRWTEFPTVEQLRDAVVNTIIQSAQEAIRRRGRFDIVLAGGGTPKAVYAELAKVPADWACWHIWFGDERCLPPEHADRNSHMADAAWLSKVVIPGTQIHVMPSEIGAEAAAESYSRALEGVVFDLVLLGLGEDGHTASLFPGHVWDSSPMRAAIPVHGAPKPPSDRVSLSLSRLKQALHVLFIVTGAGKRDAVKAWKAGDQTLPVTAMTGNLEIYLDSAAA
jgi:6-phosphogluconolactonase